MASKTLPASTGYFNKEMQAILNRGETKTSGKKKGTSAKKSGKNSAKR